MTAPIVSCGKGRRVLVTDESIPRQSMKTNRLSSDELVLHTILDRARSFGADGERGCCVSLIIRPPLRTLASRAAIHKSADDVDHARRVIAAFEEAEAEGRGVITIDGRMIENLHVDNGRRVIAVADAITALG